MVNAPPFNLREEWNIEDNSIGLVGPVRVFILDLYACCVFNARDAQRDGCSQTQLEGVLATNIGPASRAVHSNILKYVVRIIWTRHGWRIKNRFIHNFSIRHYHTK